MNCIKLVRSAANKLSQFDLSTISNLQQVTHKLWFCLEGFVLQKQINQLGIADLDKEALKLLRQSTRVKPTIAQINVAACCAVPPTLKEFYTRHDIQLLTHIDPDVMFAFST
uniref:GCS light chain n=1 Tax=Glossina brevipalpis TaxID=37001 RepID=A0A1A9WQW5_9MUSC